MADDLLAGVEVLLLGILVMQALGIIGVLTRLDKILKAINERK